MCTARVLLLFKSPHPTSSSIPKTPMDYHYPPLSSHYDLPPQPSPALHHHYHHPPPPLSSDPYYHHHHHLLRPPTAMASSSSSFNSDIHTLFISGLPDDVKPREIHNLFRRRPAFETCLLEYTGRGNQVVAFATFFNHQAAVAAIADLNGAIFDPATGVTLHIELARSNSRRRPRGDGAYDIIDKRAKFKHEDDNTWSHDGDGGPDDSSSKKGALAATQSGDGEPDNSQAASNAKSNKASSNDVSPFPTLFIANLSPTCTEEELKQILSGFPGFLVLKMQGTRGKPVAFANFADVESSTEAREKLRGTLQGSADEEGLYLEYAKSKMRKA